MIELNKISKEPIGRKPNMIKCDDKIMSLKEYADYCGVSYSRAYIEYNRAMNKSDIEKRDKSMIK
jgi:hypothetical protein